MPFARSKALAPLVMAILAGIALAQPAPAPSAPPPVKGDAPAPVVQAKIRAVASIPPLTGLVRALSIDETSIRTLITPGRSEHGYEPAPSDLAEIANADIVVYVGLGLEPWLEKYLKDHPNPKRREVCFAKVVGLQPDATPAAHDDADHAGHDHAKQRVDPHLWLDPGLLMKFVPELGKVLRDIADKNPLVDGSLITGLQIRERAFMGELAKGDAAYKQQLAPYAGRAIVTQHNAFSRLADRYGFKIAATIQDLEAVEPTPGDIARIVEEIKKQKVRAVACEPQTNPAAARQIAKAAGVKVITLDPLGGGDLLGLMQRNLDELKRGLGDDPPRGAPEQPPSPGAHK